MSIIQSAVEAVSEVVLDLLIVAGAWVIMSVPAVLEARNDPAAPIACEPTQSGPEGTP